MSEGHGKIEKHANEDGQRRRFFASFARSHASAFKPHWKEGQTLGSGPDVWRNVSEHCLVEAVLADVLSELLQLTPQQRTVVVHAALVHDWFKKHEKRIQRDARTEGRSPLEAYEESREEDARQLRVLGVDEEVIRLADAPAPRDRSGPQTIEEKVMWYVDGILSNTEPVRFRERFSDLERGWDGIKEDPARAAFNKDFSEMFKARYDGVALYDVQRELADRIEPELASLAGFDGDPTDLPLYLKEKIEERVRAS